MALALTLLVVALWSPVDSAQAQAPDKAEALSAAARKGDAAAVARLLDEGVDVNTKFRYGVTALSYAADHGHLEVVKTLLARGADVNVKDTFYSATPLTWAASPAMARKPEHAEIVGLLLKHGATGKDTALMSAVAAPDARMTKIILDSGGLSESRLTQALESAQRAKAAEIVALLEAAGAKPFREFALDEAQLTRLAGSYRGATEAEVVIVTLTGGKLFVDLSRLGAPPKPFALLAQSETTFVMPDAGAATVVFRIESGKVTAMVLGPRTFTRVGGG